MGHAINPRSQRATPIERGKTAPDRDVYILQQIAATVGIRFIRPGQPIEGRTKCLYGFPIALVLAGA